MSGHRRGLSNLRTAGTTQHPSRPERKENEYLQLFILAKQKERLEDYRSSLVRSKERVERELEEVSRKMREEKGKIGADRAEAHRKGGAGPGQGGKFKKLDIEY